MNKQTGIIAGAIVVAILLIGGVAIAVSGGGDEPSVEASTDTTTTTTLAPVSGGSSGGGSSQGGSSGGSSQGGSSGGSGGGAPANQQPQFQPDHSAEAYCEDNKAYARVDLHAYDSDGPEDQEVYQVEFRWGDDEQTVIPGSDGSNNAFSSTHAYSDDYKGQSVHIVVRAIDDDGGSAEFSKDVTLPTVASCPDV